jgi:hypothetical protein
VTTAPKPLVINCDGASALAGAARIAGDPPNGQGFLAVDASTRATWRNAIQVARHLVTEGEAATVIVDTVSLLCDSMTDEISQTLKGWDIWTELNNSVMRGIKELTVLPAHLFVVAHMTPDFDAMAGILPAIGGKLKLRLPAILDDWILLSCDPDREPQREFLLGPQRGWNHSGRSIRRTCAIPADVGRLFEELQIKP